MNDKLIAITGYVNSDIKWPGSLKTAKQISEATGISEQRIKDLADIRVLPHWRIDGEGVFFQVAEVKRWAAKNLLERIEGKELPFQLRVSIIPPPATDAPISLQNLENLRALNISDAPPGVYFLVKKKEVVYVGQSVSPYARIGHHMTAKDFDQAYLLPVPKTMLDAVEGAIIRALNPPLNSGERVIATGPGDKKDDDFVLERFAPSLAKVGSK